MLFSVDTEAFTLLCPQLMKALGAVELLFTSDGVKTIKGFSDLANPSDGTITLTLTLTLILT